MLEFLKTHWKRILLFVFVAAILGLCTWGSYGVTKKFLMDRVRLSVTSLRGTAIKRQTLPTPNQPSRTERTYTQKELEEARKKGKLPPEMRQPYMPPANTAANDAVQRSLRTIEEINRINEMNQRLMDQQRRLQNQK